MEREEPWTDGPLFWALFGVIAAALALSFWVVP